MCKEGDTFTFKEGDTLTFKEGDTCKECATFTFACTPKSGGHSNQRCHRRGT